MTPPEKKCGLPLYIAELMVAAEEDLFHCARCGSGVAVHELAAELIEPSGEDCADCFRRDPQFCLECRAQWARQNEHFACLCRECRETTVLC
jgi:hypothetical protein